MNKDAQKQKIDNLVPEPNIIAVANRHTTSEALASSSAGKQHEQQPIRPFCANKINNNSNFNHTNTNTNNNTNNTNNNNNAKLKSNFLSNLLESNSKNHKRQESDSKLTSNFTRGFRREHSDFFPSSKRHSVVLGERQSAFAHLVPHRSSAIYSAKYNKCNSGEPILTDFVSRAYLENSPTSSCAVTTATTITTAASTTTTTTITTKPTASSINPITTSASSNALDNKKSTDKNVTNNSRNLFFMGPRREKTESVISLRNSANRNLLFDQLQVKLFKPKTKPKKKTIHTPKAKSNIENQKKKKINTNPIHANIKSI